MLTEPAYGLTVVVILVLVANGAPVLASRLFPSLLSQPVDCGLYMADGRRVLGRSKTVRGLIAAVTATALAAEVFGVAWYYGAAAGMAAMVGDMGSSFIKRRMGLEAGEAILGLDQLPESLLPTLVLMGPLALSPRATVGAVVLFFVVGLPLSLLLHRLGVRERPF